MRFTLMVTGPAFGTQQSSSALQFVQASLKNGHQVISVFFYQEGVHNANRFTSPASDEFDVVQAWQSMSVQHSIKLYVCASAALRRGIINNAESVRLNLSGFNLENSFLLSGLSMLAEAALRCDRMIQF